MKRKLQPIVQFAQIIILSCLFSSCENKDDCSDTLNEVNMDKQMTEFPEQKKSFRISPYDVIHYYNIDNDEVFQTLTFLPFKSKGIPPYSIIGRIHANKVEKDEYSLDTIEAKFYTFRSEKNPNPYRVKKISYYERKSSKDTAVFAVQIARICDFKNKCDADYFYENLSNEVIIKDDATLAFWVNTKPFFKEDSIEYRPINGGYECNGKVITSK